MGWRHRGTIKGIFGAEVDLAYARHFYGSDDSLGNNYVFTVMPSIIVGVPVGGERPRVPAIWNRRVRIDPT